MAGLSHWRQGGRHPAPAALWVASLQGQKCSVTFEETICPSGGRVPAQASASGFRATVPSARGPTAESWEPHCATPSVLIPADHSACTFLRVCQCAAGLAGSGKPQCEREALWDPPEYTQQASSPELQHWLRPSLPVGAPGPPSHLSSVWVTSQMQLYRAGGQGFRFSLEVPEPCGKSVNTKECPGEWGGPPGSPPTPP